MPLFLLQKITLAFLVVAIVAAQATDVEELINKLVELTKKQYSQ